MCLLPPCWCLPFFVSIVGCGENFCPAFWQGTFVRCELQGWFIKKGLKSRRPKINPRLQIQRKVSGCRLKRGRAQQKECKKGGLIALQPPQFETHCLSTSMTEQPFLRLIPLDIKETLRSVKQSVVSSRLNRGSCGLHGLHGLPSFLAGVGFIVFLGLCGFVAQKVVDIRHPPWCRRPRWQSRAAFLQSATSCMSAFGGTDMRIMPAPALAGRAAMGECFVAP